MYAAVAGPGIVTALAGNGASGITTYSVIGSRFGLSLVWLLTICTVSLAVFQEMSARMGAVTGKGLASLIRERFGLRLTFFAMMVLLVANVAITIAEFAGVAASLELFGLSKYITVPAIAIFIWVVVTKGSFSRVEKVFLAICLIQVSYLISGFMVKPDWGQVALAMVKPEVSTNPAFVLAAIAIVGTTVAPWMQFFVQSNVVDKGIDMAEYKYERMDVITGSILSNVISLFIIICTAFTLFPVQVVETAEQAAVALSPLAGSGAKWLFGFGLFGASMLAASVVPLSTSYAVCEAFGWESGIGRKLSEAPIFFGIYSLSILLGVVVVLIPGVSLVRIMLLAQELNGILLPVILIFMLTIVNDPQIMGEHVNGPAANAIAWITACGAFVLGLVLFVTGMFAL
ncbi:MAG: Nramp family divalent metal transporter [Actinobacteria bacterium]|nr:Nramp family divalent metal transporter [Actinomycetota bacterium]MCG2817942.1 Nramp family divalent metal transporter [Actinomycetes bacterium]MBU4219120.1 Nramp family divalent metal transporter [Actinomycetota bacterium]MBU4358407.1 Nramp family divalent metal transporter [Actinomycetota bacterium]MBU4391035.1 Nramp family divalent metal transporter [Actinomycetota bacterium]